MQPDAVQKYRALVSKSYNEIADEFSHTRSRPWPEFDVFKEYLHPGSSVLDLGCGNGRLYGFLKQFGIQYLGIDNNARFIELAQARFAADQRASFQLGDILDPDTLPPEQYDAVFLVAALQHIPSSALRQQALATVRHRLKPGGHLFMTNWNLWQHRYRNHLIKNWLQKVTGRSDLDWNDILLPSFGKTTRYYHAFTAGEITRLLPPDLWHLVRQERNNRNYLTVATSLKKEVLRGTL